MCVIICKEKNKKIPTKEYLKKAWNSNPNGAGFMFNFENQVIGFKGFLNFKEFYKKLLSVDKKYNLYDKNLVLHFRIATHGGINKENTQPFIISHKDRELESTNWTSTVGGFAHNGILSNYGTSNAVQNKKSDYDKYLDTLCTDNYVRSDTADFCARVLDKLKGNFDNLLLDVIANDNYSRFAILTPSKMFLYGTWFVDGDYYISNDYFLVEIPTSKNKSSEIIDDDCYYDYYDFLNDDVDFVDYCDGCGQKTTIKYIDKYTKEQLCSNCHSKFVGW